MLNLQPVLIIHFRQDLVNYVNRIKLHSLKHLYYEYTLPVNFGNYWSEWIKVENKILTKFISHNTRPPITNNNHFDYLNKLDDSIGTDTILTGGRAYDLMTGTSYFDNSNYDFITADAPGLISKLKNLYDMVFDEINVEYTGKIPYFYTHIQLYYNDVLIFNVFEYSRLINYIEINNRKLSNYHGISFHLLHESLDNDYYVKELLMNVKKNGLVNNFEVFQKNYSLDFVKKMVEKRSHN